MTLISSRSAKGEQAMAEHTDNDTPEALTEVTVTMPNGVKATFQVNEKDAKSLTEQFGQKKAPASRNKARS